MKVRSADFRVEEGDKVTLDNWPTAIEPIYESKKQYQKLLKEHVDQLSSLQQLLYASNRYALLLIFQAMDAAGKDGAIKHVMSGVNPQGCQVFSYKHPSATELQHDFLWRTTRDLPERGRIGIFNPISGSWVLAKSANPCRRNAMSTGRAIAARHPAGEQPSVEYGRERSVIADTFAGRVHVEWEKGEAALMTPLGQLPFFIEYLKQGGLFDAGVAGCPLSLTSPNAPSKRDILGTVMLSVLAGHRRYAHITTLRCDPVNPPLLGMAKVVSEDAVRRALSKIEAEAGRAWLQEQLDYCTRPLLREPWILDVDTTVKPLYGHQEGAVVGYNPKKPGRPSHTYHSYMLANLRLVLEVEVQAGNQHAAKHSAPGLWTLLDRLGPQCAPWLLRGDRDWGNEGVISETERRGQAYLF